MGRTELAVQKVIDTESAPGEIVRAERSALAPRAQSAQDLLDYMMYRRAGLTDGGIAGLKERLARML
jgi:hypothetical protein